MSSPQSTTCPADQFQDLVDRARARVGVSADQGRPARYDLVDPDALRFLAETMAEGHAAGKDAGAAGPEWEGLSWDDHLARAHTHLELALVRNDEEDHLRHAYCRLMMALAKREAELHGHRQVGRGQP